MQMPTNIREAEAIGGNWMPINSLTSRVSALKAGVLSDWEQIRRFGSRIYIRMTQFSVINQNEMKITFFIRLLVFLSILASRLKSFQDGDLKINQVGSSFFRNKSPTTFCGGTRNRFHKRVIYALVHFKETRASCKLCTARFRRRPVGWHPDSE